MADQETKVTVAPTVSTVAAIAMAVAAIPQILTLLSEFVKFMRSEFGDNWSKYLADSGEAFKNLNNAETPEQKAQAATDLAKLAQRWGTRK